MHTTHPAISETAGFRQQVEAIPENLPLVCLVSRDAGYGPVVLGFSTGSRDARPVCLVDLTAPDEPRRYNSIASTTSELREALHALPEDAPLCFHPGGDEGYIDIELSLYVEQQGDRSVGVVDAFGDLA